PPSRTEPPQGRQEFRRLGTLSHLAFLAGWRGRVSRRSAAGLWPAERGSWQPCRTTAAMTSGCRTVAMQKMRLGSVCSSLVRANQGNRMIARIEMLESDGWGALGRSLCAILPRKWFNDDSQCLDRI